LEIKRIPVDQINPAPYNPRKELQPGDPEYEKLKKSILTFGVVQVGVFNKRTGNLVGGHQTRKVLIDIGRKEMDCVVVDLPLEKEKALNIALNKIRGDWDELKLKNILDELKITDDIFLTGFDKEEIENLTKESEIINIDDLLTELEMDSVIEKPIWITARGSSENKEAMEKAFEILTKAGIMVEKSYE
jgi:ParB-like chromosome segregation protein Spo0J